MQTLLKLEEAGMFVFGLVLLRGFGLEWWWLLILASLISVSNYPDSFQNTHLGRIGKA